MDYVLVLVAGLFAGTLGGVVGTGSSLVMMPILVVMFGPRQAVPIMAVAAIMGNLGRVLAWRREIDWRACGAYCAPPCRARSSARACCWPIPPGVAETALGIFFLVADPGPALAGAARVPDHAIHLTLLGAPLGVLTGMVVSTGPLTVPLFTFYGLERGAFLGTEAASSIGVYAAKVATFQVFGALPPEVLVQGLIVGSTLMAGSFLGRFVVLRLAGGLPIADRRPDAVSGVSLLWAAFR